MPLKLLYEISAAYQNRKGTLVFPSSLSFLYLPFFLYQPKKLQPFRLVFSYCRLRLSRPPARIDTSSIFHSPGPFLPHSTQVDVPVSLLVPRAASFCSSSLLPTDYAPSSRCAPAHRLPRFASCRLSPSLLALLPYLLVPSSRSFSCGGVDVNIHCFVAPTILRLSLSPSAGVSLFLESSLFFHATRLGSTQLDLSRTLSFPFELPLSPFHTNHSPSSSTLPESRFVPSL